MRWYQSDIVVLDKDQKMEKIIHVAIPSDSNVRKKEHEKLGKFQVQKVKGDDMGSEDKSGISHDRCTKGCDLPNLASGFSKNQEQILRFSVQNCAILGIAEMPYRIITHPGPSSGPKVYKGSKHG